MWKITPTQPSPALSPYIHLFWDGTVPPGDTMPVVFLPPTGYTSLLVPYGKNTLQLRNYGERLTNVTKPIVIGQYFNNLETHIPDCYDMIGVLFSASVLHRTFGINMNELTHKILDADLIFGTDICTLVDQFKEANTNAKRIFHLENYFLQKFKQPRYKTHIVDDALDLMIHQKGIIRVNELASYFKCSTRLLEKKFQHHVGLTPKYMNRIIQFNHMLELLKSSPNLRWADLALEAGYYDQSHLITAFIEFTGSSPLQYNEIDNEITKFYLKKKNT